MKKLMLYVASLATLLFTGCSKEQSELSIDDVQSQATISGKVIYNGGVYWDKKENKSVTVDGIGSDVTVVVKVNNKDYKGENGTYQYFETKTDANGFFSISIPVYNSINNAEVYNLPFYGKWQEVEYIDGEFKNKQYSNVLMKMTTNKVSATEKEIKFVTISTTYENEDQFKK